ncbi:Atrial natriuretic peptide receptor 1 [Taenia solium]
MGGACMVTSGLLIRNKQCHATEVATIALPLSSAFDTFIIKHTPYVLLRPRIGLHRSWLDVSLTCLRFSSVRIRCMSSCPNEC